jgi:hypothetical protein
MSRSPRCKADVRVWYARTGRACAPRAVRVQHQEHRIVAEALGPSGGAPMMKALVIDVPSFPRCAGARRSAI